MMSFATSLNFTSANEDGATELAALSLGPDDTALALTGSGVRALDLLVSDVGRVVAVDMNPTQSYLLALKVAALRELDDDQLFGFLGLSPHPDRLGLFTRIAPALDPEARAFWHGKPQLIRAGVWHAGRWERVLRFGATGTRLLRGTWIDRLFEASDLETQSAIWDRHFDDWVWHLSLQVLSARWLWTRIIGEPGGAFLPDGDTTKARLAGKFSAAARQFFFRDSDFARLIFYGQHTPQGALPLHLCPGNLDLVRQRLDRLTIRTGSLTALSALDIGAITAFSLSDFSSYTNQTAYDACWQGVLAVAAPNARFCERIFMNQLVPGSTYADQIRIDEPVSAALTQSDRAIIYDVRAGRLKLQG